MKLLEFYKNMQARLQSAGISNVDLEARWILQKRAGIEWSDILSDSDKILSAGEINAMNGDVERRLTGEPLSKIYGEKEFWGLTFQVNVHVLDPRPDTETLVEAVLKFYGDNPPPVFADLGTGSGCIAIALLTEWPEARCVAIDCSEQALTVARVNAEKNHVSERLRFLCGNWFDSVEEAFDLVVSNPPYITNQSLANLSESVKNYDPILALAGGEDGLQAYKDIFSALSGHLKTGGKGFFEIGFDQQENVVRLAEESGFQVQGVHRDLAQHPRVVEISCGDK